MKTKTILLLLAITSGILFDACKKGENDPFISFKSRSSRLKGDWKLISGTITTKTGTNTLTETYDGATMITTFNGSQTGNKVYTDNISFDKKGTYIRSGITDTVSFNEEGYWAWINKNETAGLKNKEALGMSSTIYTDSNGSVNSDAGFFVAGIWMLDELSSKKMVVIVDGSSTTGNLTTTKKGTYTYEKK
jgi:hypothetical protein